MLLVILGAGASYDSYANDWPVQRFTEERPPLANELFGERQPFAELVAQLPAMKAIVPQLRNTDNVEAELAHIAADIEEDSGTAREVLSVRFYLQEAIQVVQDSWLKATSGVLNHGALLRRLRQWQRTTRERIRFVTFNYDLLLENSLAGAMPSFRQPRNLHDYITERDVRVYKPHGSINWYQAVTNTPDLAPYEHLVGRNERNSYEQLFRAVSSRELRDALINEAHLLDEVPRSTFIGSPGHFRHTRLNGDAYVAVPSLAIPLEEKTDFVFPGDHLNSLTEDLRSADRILIIGWRGTENHFLKLWRENKAHSVRCLTVDPHPEDVLRRIQDAGCIDDGETFRGGFSDLILNISRLEKFLGIF